MEAILKGVRARRVREHNLMVQAAWLGARLTAYAPPKAKEFTKLDRLLTQDERAPARRQTWQQQLAITSTW